jgi:[ribosomal protein S5]-alanine N-acetyltransferase
MCVAQIDYSEIQARDLANKVIETKRVTLQPLSMRYLGDIHTGYTPEVAKHMFSQPGSVADTSTSIIECFKRMEHNQDLYFTIVSNETLRCLGCAGIRILANKAVFPRFWLRQDVWSNGYGLEVLQGLVFFIKKYLPCEYVYVSVDKDNIAAQVILKKVGGKMQKHWYPHEDARGEENLLVSYKIFFSEK